MADDNSPGGLEGTVIDANQSPAAMSDITGAGAAPNTPAALSDITGVAAAAPPVAAAALPVEHAPLHSIWDDDKIKKQAGGWTCLWCNTFYTKVNATKALAHTAGISRQSIRPCAGRITQDRRLRYQQLYRFKSQAKIARQVCRALYRRSCVISCVSPACSAKLFLRRIYIYIGCQRARVAGDM